MVSSKPDDHILAPQLFTWMVFLTLCAGSAVCVQAQDARSNNAEESWTATTAGQSAASFFAVIPRPRFRFQR